MYRLHSPIYFTAMNEQSSEYLKRFEALIELDEKQPSKLGISNERLYISWIRFQGLQRRFYGENRDKILEYLETQFTNYIQFYNKLVQSSIQDIQEQTNSKYVDMINEHRSKWSLWLRGLNILSNVYKEDKECVRRIYFIKKKFMDLYSTRSPYISKSILKRANEV
jgi:hypothetical protein